MLHQQYHEYFPSQAIPLGNNLCDLTSNLLPRILELNEFEFRKQFINQTVEAGLKGLCGLGTITA